MHKFNNSWLFQREKIDNLSKSKILIKRINKTIKKLNDIRIIDLGTGTGSNFRYLSKKINFNNQKWTLMDISKSSLEEAKKNISINKKIKKISIINNDIIKNIHDTNFNNFDLVSGSAFLDIMPRQWFKSFHYKNINTKIIYFSINYDGYFKFFPKHKLDKRVLDLFNFDQKSNKLNNLKAVGPDCSKIIQKYFHKTHKTFLRNSNWNKITNKKFQLMFLDFCSDVIHKHGKNDFSEWFEFRKQKIALNKSKLTVHNKDFLAVKI